MNRGLYRKLAISNIRKNKNTFFPFTLSAVIMIAMFYMLTSIWKQAGIGGYRGATTVTEMLGFGIGVCAIFSLFVVFYTNSFLIRQRTKELGLYSMLGMEKKHITMVVIWELFFVGAGSIVLGLISGVLFSKLMYMILLKMLGLDTAFSFSVSGQAVILTVALFTGVFLLAMLANTIRIYRLKPIELMRENRAGEKAPKAKWLLAVCGVVCLAIGYYLAVTTEDVGDAFGIFFIAVLLVIAGTYQIFLSGSIALLTLLKNNKKYYYHKTHFITVSGMMYRMKQNAVGLATICILSTMVLVTLSTTVSLYVGIDDMIRERFPREINTSLCVLEGSVSKEKNEEALQRAVDFLKGQAKMYHLEFQNEQGVYHHYGWVEFNGNRADCYNENETEKMYFLCVYDVNEYKRKTGKEAVLEQDEVFVYMGNDKEAHPLSGDTIWLYGKEYRIKEQFSELPFEDDNFSIGSEAIFVVMKDGDAIEDLVAAANDQYKQSDEMAYVPYLYYDLYYDLKGNQQDKQQFLESMDDMEAHMTQWKQPVSANSYDEFSEREDAMSIFGTLFFIGIFIGAMFLVTTIMIIYYKQVSEGNDDRERFIIMQKVGMGSDEVRKVIRSQILQVFFLPILLAVVHICFAFRLICRMLEGLSLTNVSLFAGCMVATVVVFFIVYGISFYLTSKTYYRIVESSAEKGFGFGE